MAKRNKNLAKQFQGQPCIAKEETGLYECGHPSNGDHIICFKRLKQYDFLENIWALCPGHHREKEDKGLTAFAKKYGLEVELLNRGLEFSELTQRWYWSKESLLRIKSGNYGKKQEQGNEV